MVRTVMKQVDQSTTTSLLAAASTFKSGMLVVARASLGHDATHRTLGGLNGGGFQVFIIGTSASSTAVVEPYSH